MSRSFTSNAPIFCPSRKLAGVTNGICDMTSTPAATTTEASPALMCATASITDFIPLPHTMLML
ncbi:Uncharacterised protein [Vibrio cholerae]|nr:Uncharacterised protein [Vibrio cholerae]